MPAKVKLKEPLAGFLHFIGMFLAIVAMLILIHAGRESLWKVLSFSIYGATMILLYLFSTLYHWVPKEFGGKNQIYRKLDHLSIYLLISGTYTPFCLVNMRGPWGWSLFGVIWGLALLGILIQSIYINVPRWLTTSVYIAMGWMVIIAIQPLMDSVNINGIYLLIAGGIVYSIGGLVYTVKKPNMFKFYGYHELWHTLVMLGSLLHFLAILFYVA